MKTLIKISDLIDLSKYDIEKAEEIKVIKLAELDGKTIIIENAEPYINKKYKKRGVRAKIIVDGVEKILFTTAQIIVKQLMDIYASEVVNKIDSYAIKCKVQKIDNMYFKLVD